MLGNKLSAARVRNAKEPGWYGDGRGLWLRIRGNGAKSWALRYTFRGKAHTMSLGTYPEVTLEAARARALEARRGLKDPDNPRDPIAERRERERQARLADMAQTFAAVADTYITAHAGGWKNEKHAAQWKATLTTYAYPVIGQTPVQAVATDDVLRVLEPIWTTRTETATRLRQRMEAVLDYAAARRMRTGENPARWRGHLDKLLPQPTKVAAKRHHAALPHAEIGGFVAALQAQEGVAARAFEFAILTAARTGEVVAARWEEIDLDAAVWTIPPERMKAGKEHRVPLSPRAVAILKEMQAHESESGGYVFPGLERGKHLSTGAFRACLKRMGRLDITAHGMRSTFRDWCGEETSYPREVIEHAIAHQLRDKAEAAYARGDLFKKRRRLMDAWAQRCAQADRAGANVSGINEGANYGA